jgi:hypothetical protein
VNLLRIIQRDASGPSAPARDEHACAHVVLDESPDGLAVCGHDELPVSVHNVVALGATQVVLQEASYKPTGCVSQFYSVVCAVIAPAETHQ